MSQLTKGETFTDASPGKTVTSVRLNNHVDNASLLNGAVLDQQEKVITVGADTVLLGDSTLANSALPKKVQLTNLLPEAVRNGSQGYALDSGTANTYSVALTPAATTYAAGMTLLFKAGNANSGASTLNVNALGAISLKSRAGGDLVANDIIAGQICECVYEAVSGHFILLNALSAGQIVATHLLESVRYGEHAYAVDTGSVNAIALAPTPAPTGLVEGMVLRFRVIHANTDACTLGVTLANSTVSTANLTRPGGAPLVPGDLQVGQIVQAVYTNGAVWQILSPVAKVPAMRSGSVTFTSAAQSVAVAFGAGNAMPDAGYKVIYSPISNGGLAGQAFYNMQVNTKATTGFNIVGPTLTSSTYPATVDWIAIETI